jgi:hypothetical protein
MSADRIDFEQLLCSFKLILGIVVYEMQKFADAFKSVQGNDNQKLAWLAADFVRNTVSGWASVQPPLSLKNPMTIYISSTVMGYMQISYLGLLGKNITSIIC